MSSKQKRDLESDGVGEVFRPPTEKLTILEESPKHPNHHEHMARVDVDNPEMAALLNSLRVHGWRKTETIAIFVDGDRYAVSNGRRRVTAVRIVNVELKRAKDPRYPLRPRVIIDDDPALTEAMANEMHATDPPMVRARRYVQLRETMGAGKAAAALGLSIKDANDLALVLSNPSAELQKAVNERRLPSDVAARAAKGGTATVAKVLAKSKDANGKVNGAAAKAAVDEAHVPRAYAMRRPAIVALAEALPERTYDRDEVRAIVARVLGDRDAATEHAWLADTLARAGVAS